MNEQGSNQRDGIEPEIRLFADRRYPDLFVMRIRKLVVIALEGLEADEDGVAAALELMQLNLWENASESVSQRTILRLSSREMHTHIVSLEGNFLAFREEERARLGTTQQCPQHGKCTLEAACMSRQARCQWCQWCLGLSAGPVNSDSVLDMCVLRVVDNERLAVGSCKEYRCFGRPIDQTQVAVVAEVAL